MIFSTVVVGIDGTERSHEAIALAEALVTPGRGRLILAHAFPFTVLPGPMYEATGGRSPEQAAQGLLERLAATTRARSSAIAIEDSLPARALHELAVREDADLIVIASSRHGPAGRLLLGDVGPQVVHEAPCPVAVATAGWSAATAPTRIGVGFDGSEESRLAVACGLMLANRGHGRLRLVEVVWSVHRIPEQYELARERAAAVLGLIPERTHDAEIRLGNPVSELAASSRDLDLLVVGSRRRGPLRRVLTGSTSGALLHRAHCPLILVPRPELPSDGDHDAARAAADPHVSRRSLA